MKTKLTLVLLCLSFLSFAISPSKKQNLSTHLLEINKEWKNHLDEIPNEISAFNSDIDRIQKHLFLVIENLEKVEHDFSFEQQKNRIHLLSVLKNYAFEKQFPINLYHKERTPYFIDNLGTHCAVGYLIQQSGFEDLAKRISLSENYEYLKNIKTKGVKEWAVKFGFTLDELAWIQPTYTVPADYASIDGTTNGPVTNVETFDLDSIYGLVFTGSFTELKNAPCLNIGYFHNEQLSCLGNGIDGKINDLVPNNGIYIVGEFPFENENYQAAIFKNNQWTRYKIPNTDNAEGVAINPSYDFNSLKLFDLILYYEIENKSDIWSVDTSLNYIKRATLNGRVYDINRGYQTVVVAGKFDSCFIFNNNQIIDTLNCNNIISYSNAYVFDNSISGPVSDTIKTIELISNIYYFGGTCNFFEDSSVCISRYSNGLMQPLFLGTSMYYEWPDSTHSVEKIRLQYPDSKLYFSGDFMIGSQWTGSGYGSYNFVNNSITYENNFNGTVYDFISYLGIKYFAGDFYSNDNNQNLGYFVRDNSNVSITENVQNQLSIYPNPTTGILNIKGLEKGTDFKVLDLVGRIVSEGKTDTQTLDFTNLNQGNYILKLNIESQIKSFIFTKD